MDYVFVDESGDPMLTSKATRHFVLAFVHVRGRDKPSVDKVLSRILKRLKRRNLYPPQMDELKFNLPSRSTKRVLSAEEHRLYLSKMPEVRRRVLSVITTLDVRIGVVIVDKSKAYPSWTSDRLYNYMIVHNLFFGFLELVQPDPELTVMVDKRLRGQAKRAFDDYSRRKYEFLRDWGYIHYELNSLNIEHVASSEEPGIWMADFVAGSYFQKYERGNSEYADIIDRSGKRIYIEVKW